MADSPTDVGSTVAGAPTSRRWQVTGDVMGDVQAASPASLAPPLGAVEGPTAAVLGPGEDVGAPSARQRHRARGRSRATGRTVSVAAAAAVAVCVACVAFFGSVEAIRSPIWNPVDEGAHFAYIQQIAEHGSLPVLGKTYVSEQVLALGKGVYPRQVSTDPKRIGLAGDSYEAFQPPLYYALAVPVFDVSANFHTKVILLRFFGLSLLLVTIGLLGRLCRLVLGDRWLVGMAAGTLVLAMPGVVARCVTLSNLPLEMVLVMLAVTELWAAVSRPAAWRLLVAGGLLGLGVLTDLFTVELLPVFAVVAAVLMWRQRRWQTAAWAAGGASLGAVMVAPWLAFNEAHYHALTASRVAKAMQTPTVNPHHVHYSIHLVANLTAQSLFSPVLPQEWNLMGRPLLGWGVSALAFLVIPVALVLTLGLGRRLASGGYWVLAAPWVCNVAVCWYISIGEQWLTMLPRYTYPTLAVLAVAMAAGAVAVFRGHWPFLLTVAGFAVFLVVLWIGLLPQVGHA